jgi:hypothetical protein
MGEEVESIRSASPSRRAPPSAHRSRWRLLGDGRASGRGGTVAEPRARPPPRQQPGRSSPSRSRQPSRSRRSRPRRGRWSSPRFRRCPSDRRRPRSSSRSSRSPRPSPRRASLARGTADGRAAARHASDCSTSDPRTTGGAAAAHDLSGDETVMLASEPAAGSSAAERRLRRVALRDEPRRRSTDTAAGARTAAAGQDPVRLRGAEILPPADLSGPGWAFSTTHIRSLRATRRFTKRHDGWRGSGLGDQALQRGAGRRGSAQPRRLPPPPRRHRSFAPAVRRARSRAHSRHDRLLLPGVGPQPGGR